MTATATTEIALLDFEAAPDSGSREVGDLQLADWDCPPLEDVLSLGDAREAQRDVVVVLAASGEDRPRSRPPSARLTLPRAALVAAGCDANIPSCLVLEHGPAARRCPAHGP